MGESIGSVQLDVKLNKSSLDSEIKEAGSKSGSTFSSIFSASSSAGISGALSTVKSAVLGLGATIASGGGLFALADSAVNAGNSVYELAQKMHLPTDQAALLNRELNLSNTDSGSFISTMTKLDKGLESAGSKGNSTTDALKAFGVTLTDGHGKLLPMNQQLANLASAYQNAAANGNDEAFVAQVLGNRGVALTGILEDYNDVAAQANKTKGIGIDPNEAHQVALEVQTVKSQVSILGTTVGSAVLPIVVQAFPPIQSALANLATTIKTHQGQIQSFAQVIGGVIVTITQGVAGILNFIAGHGSAAITVIGGIVAVMGAWKAITAVMSVVMGVQNTIAAVTKAREEGVTIAKLASVAATEYQEGAQIGLNAALLACPLTWIIVGIVALVAVFVLLWTKCAWFRDFWIGLWNGIVAVFNTVKNAIGTAINAVVGFFQKWGVLILAAVLPVIGIPLLIIQHWGQISAFFEKVGAAIVGGISTAVSFVASLPSKFVSAMEALGQATLSGILAVGQFFLQLPGKIAYALGFAIGTLIKWGIDIVTWASTAIPNFIASVGTFLLELPGKILDAAVAGLEQFQNFEVSIIQWAATAIPQFIGNVGNFLMQLPGKIWGAAVAGLTQFQNFEVSIIQWAATAIPQFIGNVGNFFYQLPGRIWNAIVGAVTGMANWGGEMLHTGESAASSVVSGIIGFFTGLPSQILDIGKNIVQGLWNGITGAWHMITDGVKNLTGGFVNGFKSALGIHSPSRLMADEIGAMLPPGITIGVKAAMPNALDDIQNQFAKISTVLQPNALLATGTYGTTPMMAGLGGTSVQVTTGDTVLNLDGRTLSRAANQGNFATSSTRRYTK